MTAPTTFVNVKVSDLEVGHRIALFDKIYDVVDTYRALDLQKIYFGESDGDGTKIGSFSFYGEDAEVKILTNK